jgi:hypothetical protein
MPKSVRKFFCKRVTTSESGDYFQVLFEETSDSDGCGGPRSLKPLGRKADHPAKWR